MTLKLPTIVRDPEVQQNFDRIAMQFPIQVQNIATGFKPVVTGNVAVAGTVGAGSGFSAEKTATGIYKITLTVELATNGLIFAFSTEQNRAMRASTGIAKKVFVVNSVSFGEAPADTAFNFVVYPT